MNEGYFPSTCMLFLVFKHSLMLWIILLYHRVTFWLLSSDRLNPRYRSRGQNNDRKRYIRRETKEDSVTHTQKKNTEISFLAKEKTTL